MKLFKRSDRRGERGQAVIEFAFILPLFLIVLFLVVEFGVGFSRWIVITNSTREAARFGAVQNGDAASLESDIIDRAVVTSNGLLDASDVTVNYVDGPDINADAGDRGDSVVVATTFDYGLITPIRAFLAGFDRDSITMSACADMRLELGIDGASNDGVTQC